VSWPPPVRLPASKPYLSEATQRESLGRAPPSRPEAGRAGPDPGRAGRGAQAERARERAAALAVAARNAELEAALTSNLRRRRDELRQALAEADAGAARCAGGRRWLLASLMPRLFQGDTGPCDAGWRHPASRRRVHLCCPQWVPLLAETQCVTRGTESGDAARPQGARMQPQASLAGRRAALEAASAQAAAAAERVRGAEAAEAEAEAALEAGAARLRELAAQAERLRELEARGALGVQARARPVAASVHGGPWRLPGV